VIQIKTHVNKKKYFKVNEKWRDGVDDR